MVIWRNGHKRTVFLQKQGHLDHFDTDLAKRKIAGKSWKDLRVLTVGNCFSDNLFLSEIWLLASAFRTFQKASPWVSRCGLVGCPHGDPFGEYRQTLIHIQNLVSCLHGCRQKVWFTLPVQRLLRTVQRLGFGQTFTDKGAPGCTVSRSVEKKYHKIKSLYSF